MKRWMALLAASVVALSLSAPVMAAEGGKPAAPAKAAKGNGNGNGKGGGANAMKRLDATLAKLNLTADQQKKIEALKAETAPKLKKAREGATTPEEKRQASRPIMKAFRDQLAKILTPAQQAQFKAERAKARGQAGGGAAKGNKS